MSLYSKPEYLLLKKVVFSLEPTNRWSLAMHSGSAENRLYIKMCGFSICWNHCTVSVVCQEEEEGECHSPFLVLDRLFELPCYPEENTGPSYKRPLVWVLGTEFQNLCSALSYYSKHFYCWTEPFGLNRTSTARRLTLYAKTCSYGKYCPRSE